MLLPRQGEDFNAAAEAGHVARKRLFVCEPQGCGYDILYLAQALALAFMSYLTHHCVTVCSTECTVNNKQPGVVADESACTSFAVFVRYVQDVPEVSI